MLVFQDVDGVIVSQTTDGRIEFVPGASNVFHGDEVISFKDILDYESSGKHQPYSRQT